MDLDLARVRDAASVYRLSATQADDVLDGVVTAVRERLARAFDPSR